MPRPAKTWVITDTHFFHEDIIAACGRPLDFQQQILRNCRQLVAAQDTLIHLGDVIFYEYPRLPELLDFPGRKILVQGNHDRKPRGWYERNGFDFACDALVLGDVLFSHQPRHLTPDIRWNLHGHWHNLPNTLPDFYTTGHQLLALEYTGYGPVELQDILPQAQL